MIGRSKRLWIVGAVVAVVTVAIVIYVRTDSYVPGWVHDIYAIDANRALVVRSGDDSSSYVELVTLYGEVKWRTRVPHVEDTNSMVTVASDVVTIETSPGDLHARYPEVLGLGLDDGRILWRAKPTGDRQGTGGMSLANIFASPQADDDTVYGFYGQAEQWNEAVALDRKTGAERWRASLDAPYTGPASLHGRYLVVSQGKRFLVLARDTGRMTTIDGDYGGCVLGDTVYYTANEVLHARRIDDTSEIQAPRAPGPKLTLLGACGRRGDRVILPVKFGDEERENGRRIRPAPIVLVALDAATLAVRWQLELGRGDLFNDIGANTEWPETGALGRFLPIHMRGSDDRYFIVMIDVDAGTEAWRTRADADLLRRVVAAPDRVYVEADEELGVLDPVAKLGPTVTIGLHSQHYRAFAGGHLWLGFGRTVRTLSATTLAPVDGGAPLPAAGGLRAVLGL